MGPERARVSPLHVVEWRLDDGGFLLRSRPSVDRLATSLEIDESLAFRAFDKTIIFRHWLSKTWELALASKAFLFENGLYYILVDYLQKSKNVFQKGSVSYFHGALQLFSRALQLFSCTLPLSSHALLLFSLALLLSSHALQLSFTC